MSKFEGEEKMMDYEMITAKYFIDITANLNESIVEVGKSLQLKSSIINKSDPN